jgi:hypothetical protein
VAGLTELDLGVYRVDRREGPAWAARLFPAARPVQAAAGDGLILRFLAERDYPAERCAAAEPFSVLDGQGLLVTEVRDAGTARSAPGGGQGGGRPACPGGDADNA